MSRGSVVAILLLAAVAGGCASWSWPPWSTPASTPTTTPAPAPTATPARTSARTSARTPPPTPAATALARADQLAERGEYAQAVEAYDEYLARYSDDGDAKRALQTRDALATVVTLRQEVARLREELTKLRTDLERLKQLDLGQERRR